MKLVRELLKGFVKENPVLVLLLGLCPTLAVTTGLRNAVGMGLSATFVLVCSNLIIALFKGFFPKKIRIPCFIVVIATFVTIVQMALKAYVPDLDEALGIFIPLIVVNCIILGRAEAFASRKGALESIADGVGMGVGFTLALCVIALFRELLGKWELFGVPVTDGGFQPAAVMIMAPGAFLVLGLALGAKAWIEQRIRGTAVRADARQAMTVEAGIMASEVERLRAAEEKRKAKEKEKKAAEKKAVEEQASQEKPADEGADGGDQKEEG